MRFFLLLVFLPLFSFAQTDQQLLSGLWVKVKVEMKDGSRILDRHGCGMDFLKYNFTGDGFVNRSQEVLFSGNRQLCKKTSNTLTIGGEIFNILKMTGDTLKLSAFGAEGDDWQIPVYYLKKVDQGSAPTPATFNTDLKDSVYQANMELFPQHNGAFSDLMEAISGRFDMGVLKVSFIVQKNGSVSNYTILQADSMSNNFTKAVGKAIARIGWQPARRNNAPVNSVVTITLISRRLFVDGQQFNTLAIQYPFLPKIPNLPLDKDEMESEQQYFNDAAAQFVNKNYQKAIELLGKCVEMDNIDLNAYYLRAEACSKLGKNKEACKDWTTLVGLGQVTAAKKLAELCKN